MVIIVINSDRRAIILHLRCSRAHLDDGFFPNGPKTLFCCPECPIKVMMTEEAKYLNNNQTGGVPIGGASW